MRTQLIVSKLVVMRHTGAFPSDKKGKVQEAANGPIEQERTFMKENVADNVVNKVS